MKTSTILRDDPPRILAVYRFSGTHCFRHDFNPDDGGSYVPLKRRQTAETQVVTTRYVADTQVSV
jgi:hypothetical protein